MNSWIDVAGWTLVHFVWEGALIGLIAFIALRLLRGGSPQTRYAAACAALCIMIAAPVITAGVLSRSISPLGAGPAMNPRVEPPISGRASTTQRAPSATPMASEGSSRSTRHVTFDPWPPIVVAFWLAGVAVLLVRLAGGWWRVRRLHRAALVTGPSRWAGRTARIASSLLLHRIVHIVDSPLVDTPTVVGWLRPVIVLPVAALAGLSPSQVDAILAHELAHIRRHDFLANLLQAVAETFLFYHPAVWWISGRMRIEREHCCDLVAVSVCGDAITYAEALTELERWRGTGTTLALAATGGALLERIRRLLGVPSEETSQPFAATTIGVVAVLLVLLAGATHYLRAAQPDGDRSLTADTTADASGNAVAWTMVFNHSDSQLRLIGFTARELIRYAYQLPESRILGGPSWIDDETFTIVETLDAAPAADEMQSVVRKVLEERFQLKTHLEQRDLPVSALVMARADKVPGPNLRVSTRECFDLQAWIDAGQPPRPGLDLRVNERRQPVCGEEEAPLRAPPTSPSRCRSSPRRSGTLRGLGPGSPPMRAWISSIEPGSQDGTTSIFARSFRRRRSWPATRSSEACSSRLDFPRCLAHSSNSSDSRSGTQWRPTTSS